MMKLIIDFKNDESGAVTVDWVVLTAAIVGIGISVITVISGGVQSASEEIDGGLEVASNFSFSFDDISSMDFSQYNPLSWKHGDSWGTDANGLGWAESTYAGWSETLTDEQLMTNYENDYAYATSGIGGDEVEVRADYIAVQEQIIADRDLTTTEGNLSAAEVRDSLI